MNTTTALGTDKGDVFCVACADTLPRQNTRELSYFCVRACDDLACDRCGRAVGK